MRLYRKNILRTYYVIRIIHYTGFFALFGSHNLLREAAQVFFGSFFGS